MSVIACSLGSAPPIATAVPTTWNISTSFQLSPMPMASAASIPSTASTS
jgi:hypothetical protein